jgi:hypothetical protein
MLFTKTFRHGVPCSASFFIYERHAWDLFASTDWHSPNLEEAEQNAALLASVYLVGGKVNTKSVSHLPAVKPTIPIEQAVAKVQLELAGLAKKQVRAGCFPWRLSVHTTYAGVNSSSCLAGCA